MTITDYVSDSANSIWALTTNETKQFSKFLWGKQSCFIEIIPFLLTEVEWKSICAVVINE